MNKGIKKFKARNGRDATRSVARKLLVNFILNGKIKTTTKRAGYVKAVIDRFVSQAKKATGGSKNALQSKLSNKIAIDTLVKTIVPKLGTRTSGFTTMKRIGQRKGDASEMIVVEWISELASPKTTAVPIVVEEKKTDKVEVAEVIEKATPKKTTKEEKPVAVQK